MAMSAVIACGGFIALIISSHNVTGHLISSLQGGSDLDYRIFIAKWTSTIPYLLIMTIGFLELRSRIRYRDIYQYRKSVAASLDGYTATLLTKVEDVKDLKEQSEARKVVIEFMIRAMMELTKSPNIGHDKSSAGIKIRDIAEAKIKN